MHSIRLDHLGAKAVMENCRITRRQALLSLAAASGVLAQSGKPPIRVRSLNHMTLTVSDRKRSVEFYQGLFGLPIQHRQGVSIGLRIGSGPQYISLAQGGANARPAIAHFCMTVDRFSVERVTRALADHGVVKGDPGPMKTWVRTRGSDAGGAKEGTPELHLGDPDGIDVQLQDIAYCGGAGPLGNLCKPPDGRCGYGQLVKIYAAPTAEEQRRYSPAHVVEAIPAAVYGTPEQARICTSHIERQNGSLRQWCKRLTRLTYAFSKNWDHLKAALALHFAFYNFCRKHRTLKGATPAMAAGLADRGVDPGGVVSLRAHVGYNTQSIGRKRT